MHYIREQLLHHQTSVLNRWKIAAKDYKASCNFFNNPKVKLIELMHQISQGCSFQCPEGAHVLVLQDTTEVNYHSHNGRFKVNDPDLGVLSNNESTGLLLHAGLVVEAQSELPSGLSSVHVWHRAFERPVKSKLEREMQPLEEKESYRWLQTMQQSRTCLQKAGQVTVIGDRESDIYELFGSRPDAHTHILVRSNTDRLTASAVGTKFTSN